MKKSMRLIVLLLAVVLLFAGYKGIGYFTEQKNQVSESSGTFALHTQESSQLTEISWTKDETVFNFVKSDDAWTLAENAAFPVDQDEVNDLVSDVLALTADRKIESITNLSDYGLAEPSFSVTLKWTDNSTISWQMGSATPFSDGYYVKLSSDDSTAYVVSKSLSSLFTQSMNDFAAMETIPSAPETVTKLTVGSSFAATYDTTWHDTATNDLLNETTVKSLVSDAKAIDWAELIYPAATDSELTLCGLTEDAATVVTLSNDTESWSICIGTADENGDYYARLPGSTMIYTVSADDVADLLSADASAMYRKTLLLPAYEDLTDITFTAGGKSWAFVKATSDDTVTVTVNGTACDADSFKSLYSLVTSLSATANGTENESAENILSFTVNGTAFNFNSLSVDSYSCKLSDTQTLLFSADSIDKIVRTLKQLQ